jgi:ankyrin repeat protein
MLRSLVVILALSGAAVAQTAPSASEIASYKGLHLAAHEGQVVEINRLIAEGADLNARDRVGRTSAHVAAFASHDDALTALAEGGADMNALENRVYDVLTIAAVADDPELVSLAMALGNKADLITSVYDGTALIAAAHRRACETL